MAQKFHEFNPTGKPLEQVISRDQILTNVSVYWLTGTFGSSSWPMCDSSQTGWPEGQKAVPTGVYSGPPGIRRLAEQHNTIIHWPEDNPAGHHFIAMDRPGSLAADIAPSSPNCADCPAEGTLTGPPANPPDRAHDALTRAASRTAWVPGTA